MRFGADFAGGAGTFGKAGFGAGGGIYGGGGLSVDNAGGALHGGNVSGGTEFTGAFGVPLYGPIGLGASGSLPFRTGDGKGAPSFNPGRIGGGIGVGPRYGLAAGVSGTVTGTYRTGPRC